ncbi:hypothetical protein EZS27_011550 [termite gut metagenome]|uniref:Uncharacterized protein n=1 Tax=termite gut metagenome TaxID=433724 RepID=A0A5J4S3C9_9ZZZZ
MQLIFANIFGFIHLKYKNKGHFKPKNIVQLSNEIF